MPTETSLRIAIAEDEFLLAEDLRQLVEASGHEVVGVVATAPEFVSLVKRWRGVRRRFLSGARSPKGSVSGSQGNAFGSAMCR